MCIYIYTRLHLSLYSDRSTHCSTGVGQYSTAKYICQEVMSSTCVNMHIAPVSSGVSQYGILHLSVQESASTTYCTCSTGVCQNRARMHRLAVRACFCSTGVCQNGARMHRLAARACFCSTGVCQNGARMHRLAASGGQNAPLSCQSMFL